MGEGGYQNPGSSVSNNQWARVAGQRFFETELPEVIPTVFAEGQQDEMISCLLHPITDGGFEGLDPVGRAGAQEHALLEPPPIVFADRGHGPEARRSGSTGGRCRGREA